MLSSGKPDGDEICIYCCFDPCYGEHLYYGEHLELSKNIDGSNQEFEISLASSPDEESAIIDIEGINTQLVIRINYCPMCGKKIN